MERILQPEILDSLPPTHPDAIHNRRDLRLTNRVMRNHTWFLRTVAPLIGPGERVLEIGAGDGGLGIELIRRGVAVDAVDLWPRPAEWPASAQWFQGDVHQFSGWKAYDVFMGNLIFHQFSAEDLHGLGRAIAHARMIVACEPVRRRTSQILYRLIAPLLGANHVTLHDAHVSIAAGFRQDELPAALGLQPADWDIRCEHGFIGAYRMIAVRKNRR